MASERELTELTDRALREIADAADQAALEAVRVRYLGRKDGELTTRVKGVAALPAAQRPAAGATPRYGTWVTLSLSEDSSVTQDKCEIEPMPALPNVILARFALA